MSEPLHPQTAYYTVWITFNYLNASMKKTIYAYKYNICKKSDRQVS